MYLRRAWISHCCGKFTSLSQKCGGPLTISVDGKSVTFHFRTKVNCGSSSAVDRVPNGYDFTSPHVSDHNLDCKSSETGLKNGPCLKVNNGYLENNRTNDIMPTFPPVLSLFPHATQMTLCKKVEKTFRRQCSRFYSTCDGRVGPDFDVLANNVIQAAKKINVLAGSIQVAKVVTLLRELHSRKLPLRSMEEVLSRNLQMLQEPENVVKLTDLLLSHGLRKNVVVDILKTLLLNEVEMSYKNVEALINDCLHQLRGMGFSEDAIHSLLASEPKVLLVSSTTLDSVFSKLKGLFTKVDAIQVIKNSPNVLSDPWVETNEKFDYAYFTMGYKQKDIMKSYLFGHTLQHIKDRHIFLVRAGFFYPVKEKDDPRLNPNPPLNRVIDTGNKFFAHSFGGMSHAELETYLLMREVEEAALDFSDGTDDDEEEEQSNSKKSKKRITKR